MPFGKVILERGKRPENEADDCIHIQYRSSRPRRLAFLGPTHSAGWVRPPFRSRERNTAHRVSAISVNHEFHAVISQH